MTPDAVFSDPRLAAIYDDLDPDRSDLDHYESIVSTSPVDSPKIGRR